MKGKYFVWFLAGLIGICVLVSGLDLAFGWFGVYRTKTVEKAQQDAEREVFEQTQSYVEGKRQEALKLYQEWRKEDESGKEAIEAVVTMSFANFDEGKLPDELRVFVYNCKYK